MRKVVSCLALLGALVGSAALAGTAQAGDSGDTAVGGKGGSATDNCLNIGIDVLSGIGVAGQGVASGASCVASANGGNATA